jgi:hypothetical protein
MGGSSSHFNGSQARREMKAVQNESQSAVYEAACNDFLRELLAAFNDRNVEAVRTHLSEIERALGKEVEGSIDLLFGGSIAKRTYVEGLSDVDALVNLDNCELANATPDEAKFYLVNRLQERFPRSEITEGRLAVTVRFADAEVQLLPSVTCKSVTHIADESGKQWAPIKPREFAQVLSQVNSQNGSKVVPVVKLAKGIVAGMPERQQISGYHAESLAVEVFRGYAGPYTLKEMVKHYFDEASRRVLNPIRDRTGQSVHVDDSLGPADSLERRTVSDAFARVARRMGNADAAGTLENWKGLFGVD